MNGKTIGIIVVVLIVLGGAWYALSSGSTTQTPTTGTQTQTGTQGSTATSTTGSLSTGTAIRPFVSYTDQGFSPATLTVAEGTTVTFENDSSNPMWIASDPHPTHQGYDGTTRSQHCVANYTGPAPFDECTTVNKGGTFTFTFTKAGSFGYHNHAGAEDHGTITVTAPTGVSGGVNVTM